MLSGGTGWSLEESLAPMNLVESQNHTDSEVCLSVTMDIFAPDKSSIVKQASRQTALAVRARNTYRCFFAKHAFGCPQPAVSRFVRFVAPEVYAEGRSFQHALGVVCCRELVGVRQLAL